jgi:dephospho-CoA kinase
MSFVLGLTGSIGMGKSTTAAMFRAEGIRVHDADAAVHALYQGAAVLLVEAAFPGTVVDGRVDRQRLGQHVVGNPGAMKRLEAIIHPLVRACEDAFRADAAQSRAPLIVLDVPLLFETGGAARCDAVLVVTASPDIQRQRVLARSGMTIERFEALLARQMPDAEKRRHAHFLVDTGHGLESARDEVRAIVRALAGRTSGRSRQETTSDAA